MQNLLTEAYEQLEQDTEKEIANAMKFQNARMFDLEAKSKGLELELEERLIAYKNLEGMIESMEQESKELRERNRNYEQGIDGLQEVSLV